MFNLEVLQAYSVACGIISVTVPLVKKVVWVRMTDNCMHQNRVRLLLCKSVQCKRGLKCYNAHFGRSKLGQRRTILLAVVKCLVNYPFHHEVICMQVTPQNLRRATSAGRGLWNLNDSRQTPMIYWTHRPALEVLRETFR